MKNQRYWQMFFYVLAIIIVSEVAICLFAFFIFPSNPVSDFASLSNLPAKYLLMVVIGGASKEFFMGVITYHAWAEWHTQSNSDNKSRSEQ